MINAIFAIFSITCYSLYHKNHWSFDCAIMNLRWVQLWNRTHVFVCLYLHLLRKELIINREGCDPINQFNHVIILCMYQARTWISIDKCCLFCVQWIEARGVRFVWWNCFNFLFITLDVWDNIQSFIIRKSVSINLVDKIITCPLCFPLTIKT